MFSKHGREQRPLDDPPTKRLRTHLLELATTNKVSFQEARELFADAFAAGCSNVKDFTCPTSSDKNVARDMKRLGMKGCKWPKQYTASITCYNSKRQQEEKQDLQFFLPHELLHHFAGSEDQRAVLEANAGLDFDGRLHMQKVKAATGDVSYVAIGMWGDGVPVNFDRSESVEVLSMNFPGLTHAGKKVRLPLTCFMKHHEATRKTMDEIFEVLSWSFQHCFSGKHPHHRHDGSPWHPGDRKRSKMAGVPLNAKAILNEVRGDWAFFKHVFSFPGWREVGGCCWKCNACKEDLHRCGSDADWRQARWSHFDLLQYLHRKGHISKLFGCPFLTSDCFRIDWLHCADLGVAADCLGNVFVALLKHMPGQSQAAKCSALYLEIQQWYRFNSVEDQLLNLTPKMLCKKSSSPPKLRAKAAVVRALVPFADYAARKWLDPSDVMEMTIRGIAKELLTCYSQLDPAIYEPATLREASLRFSLQYVSLDKLFQGQPLWRAKPKLHLFQELCEMQRNCPSHCWTYRDEDFGGAVARYVRRRGGARSFGVASSALLINFALNHQQASLLV